ncbi:YggS family pyridoxal phosphate-dependent enzyme [Thiothrix fructosivorans]|jgi:pyridoxal phosphate enzyme (YggS family)|uniref:Pyridoxal phosphate homeostasis protein n=1 Tax=Thiothrix fructosivorans TaxID=111770 RepID=A0A8B0SMU8_9GAMM|nr:YggS family pyridoxal phosphate-dependent enzyme [Thiothrix fructosivorans]MBO0612130.1 YggS family pyridoxal phosphate-dependent enzyme [Thiothrix fructosivorans]QTX12371.1 YggS family pyridoxal phosphate-dependent enzyme [Thiothrix fructosivorans]
MTIRDNIQTIGERIRAAEQHFGREAGSVELLAVSKKHPAASIREAIATGQTQFGENYVQEMVEKAAELAGRGIEWHFIGPIQSNKTRLIAATARWVHSVDSVKIAQRLSEQKPADAPDINICLQVNISDEASKSGVAPAALPELAAQVAGLPGICLRGLMAIPAPEPDVERQRAVFAQVRHLQESLIAQGFALDTLSMGMTDDMEAAIAEGATIVRIGTAIFGVRH